MGRTILKRRDKKGRLLNAGEYQKENGMYEYRYKDIRGKQRSVYSWRLTASDMLPAGKDPCKPLRELETKLIKDLKDGIDTYTAQSSTLNMRFDLYMESKINLRRSTRQNYLYMYNKYVRDEIGCMKISDINYSVLKQFYNSLIIQRGLQPNTVDALHSVLNPVFETAVWDKLIKTNDCPRVMKTIRQSNGWKTEKKAALTLEQQQAFMRFLDNSPTYQHWSNLMTVLLGTGMRICECLGLTWNSCDFDENAIYVLHTLNYRKQEDGHCGHYVEFTPKTPAGVRTIPMFDEVRTALLNEKERQIRVGTANTVIDGVGGWVFTNRYGTVYTEASVNRAIERIRRAYNAEEEQKAIAEKRIPFLLPHFTCHQLRHTFCTRLCENEYRSKIVQTIMGHANIRTTMDVYAEVENRVKRESVDAIQGKLFIK